MTHRNSYYALRQIGLITLRTIIEFVQFMVIHNAFENQIICWSAIDWTKLSAATPLDDTDTHIQQQRSTQETPLCPRMGTDDQCLQHTRTKLFWFIY